MENQIGVGEPLVVVVVVVVVVLTAGTGTGIGRVVANAPNPNV